MSKQKIVIIVGPTASGKTSLAVQLAKKYNGEIISADSMQVFKEMNIGTAKVTTDEMQGINHYLIDVVSPTQSFNVSMWKELAEKSIVEIATKKCLPIVVGGTGLYINALINDFTFGNCESDPLVRNKYEDFLKKNGVDALFNLLEKRDKEASKLVDKNRTRVVIRYLEILDNGGDPKKIEKNHKYDYLLLGLAPQREDLYNAINLRVDKMINNGLIDEVKSLIAKYGQEELLQSGLAIGYKEVIDYLNGMQSLEQTIELIKQHSRNYAKRQITYLKKLPNIIWVNFNDKENIIKLVNNFLEK